MRHHALQITSHAPGIDPHHIQRYAQMLGDAARIGQIIGRTGFLPTRRLDSETTDGGIELPRQGDDGAGIQTTREEGTDGHIRDHLATDGVAQMLARALDCCALIERGFSLTTKRG